MRRRWAWRCAVIGCERRLRTRFPRLCASCRWSLAREIRRAVMQQD